ncbi:hypothetical protein L7F22_021445 [Adiantum nelumboides]|nr:hypothetical protein [Adiantum nelumboides]
MNHSKTAAAKVSQNKTPMDGAAANTPVATNLNGQAKLNNIAETLAVGGCSSPEEERHERMRHGQTGAPERDAASEMGNGQRARLESGAAATMAGVPSIRERLVGEKQTLRRQIYMDALGTHALLSLSLEGASSPFILSLCHIASDPVLQGTYCISSTTHTV